MFDEDFDTEVMTEEIPMMTMAELICSGTTKRDLPAMPRTATRPMGSKADRLVLSVGIR